MIYLSSFKLSDRKINNPNIYPYNVFRDKYIEPFVFSPITVFYGNLSEAKKFLASKEGSMQEEYIKFSQPDALYLLDEPEVSLSPANQVKLAEEINKMARLLMMAIKSYIVSISINLPILSSLNLLILLALTIFIYLKTRAESDGYRSILY